MTRPDQDGDVRDERLTELARELPWERPDETRREAVRARLLAAADADDRAGGGAAGARGRGARAWMIVGGAALAAAAAAALVVIVAGRGAGERVDAGSKVGAVSNAGAAAAAGAPAEVAVLGPTDFEQVTEIAGGRASDVVRLRAGRVRIAAPARPVRVEIGGAIVEGVDGGAYEIATAHGALDEVAVERGRATIEIRGQAPVFLAAGETWKAPVDATTMVLPVAPPAPAAPVALTAPTTSAASIVSTGATASRAATHRAAPNVAALTATAPAPMRGSRETTATTPTDPRATTEPRAPTETEQQFATGWSLLRAGHFADAAAHFGDAVDAGGDQPLAEDARYFEAVALARAGRAGDAEHVLTAFLDKNPRSLRRGRAAVMLGWLLAQRGERDAARARFDEATGDPDADVAASARAGLAALRNQ